MPELEIPDPGSKASGSIPAAEELPRGNAFESAQVSTAVNPDFASEQMETLVTPSFESAQSNTLVNPEFSAQQAETLVNPSFESTQELVPDLDINTNEEVATKLDLAKAYEEMGDLEGARELLQEVMKEGDVTQRDSAKNLLAKISA